MVATGLKNPLCQQMFCYEFCKGRNGLNGINYNKALETGTSDQIWTNLQRKAIPKLGWAVLAHIPYSLDLASLDFHPFGPMRNAI
jgi:hypothetical protein